jgi:hypothetical protein
MILIIFYFIIVRPSYLPRRAYSDMVRLDPVSFGVVLPGTAGNTYHECLREHRGNPRCGRWSGKLVLSHTVPLDSLCSVFSLRPDAAFLLIYHAHYSICL